MDIPIRTDPEVLEHLYTHFAYRKSYPPRLEGSFLDEASSLGVLPTGDFLGFLLTYEEESGSYPADFSFSTKGENVSLNRYRLLRPAIPWPQPLVEVARNDRKGQGVTLGVNHVDVGLREVGTAQLRYGDETRVIWEAFYAPSVGVGPEHERLLHQLWKGCERLLVENGVRFAHTYSCEPSYEDAWHGAFLHPRSYRRNPARAHLPGGRVAVVKKLDP